MKDSADINLSNKLVRFLDKPQQEFTRADIVKFIMDNDIDMLNFRYVGGDSRLKTLNFVVTSRAQIDRLLSTGERVDGGSLLPYIDAGSSDLYVIPRYRTAYVNPFSPVPTVDILCSYYNGDGTRLSSSPENTIRRAHEILTNSTGFTMEAMGELEYYAFYNDKPLYPIAAQKGYQESTPFSKWEMMRCEAMQAIAQAGGSIKYGHSEVGNIRGEGQETEQHEIEFLPVPLEDAADQIVIAKWILRMTAYKYGITITFAPKILAGHAGNGLHIHSKLVKNGKNMMIEEGQLSDIAKKAIAGFLSLAPSLTSFGNTVPTSYLRLVPHQEAPTNICWGYKNRSVLTRVPLGWLNVNNMSQDANPQQKDEAQNYMDNQTVEFRCPDGSADIYLLLAGMAVAARHGLEMSDALQLADKLYVDVNIFSGEHKKIQERLPQLPASCWDSAEYLLKDREIYEQSGVFSPVVIDQVVKKLKSYDDKHLSERIYDREDQIRKLIEEYLHCS